MAGFAVMHFRKIKTDAGLGNVAGHNSREKIDYSHPDKIPAWITHPERINHNRGHDGKRSDSAIRKRYSVIKNAELKRKPQRNAAAAIEVVFTASPAAFKKIDEWREYLGKCVDWAEKKFGGDNVIQWNTHFDEKTPHLHMLVVPIVRDPVDGNKYSSADFLGGREGMRKLQSEFAEEVGKKYSLERGQEQSEARHTNQAEWALNLKKQEKDLEQREAIARNIEKLWTREKAIVAKAIKEAMKYVPDGNRVFDYAMQNIPAYIDQCAQAVMSNKDRPSASRTDKRQNSIDTSRSR